MNELKEMTVPLMKHMKDVTDSYQSGYDKALEDIEQELKYKIKDDLLSYLIEQTISQKIVDDICQIIDEA